MAVNVPIVAEWDGSAVKRAQTELAAFGSAMKQALAAAARDAKAGLDSVSTGLDQSGTAAQRLSAVMQQTAQRIQQQTTATAAAANALGAALGPELSAKIGQSGLNQLVRQLQTTGLTLDQITADASELANGIRALNGATLSGLTTSAQTASGAFAQTGGVMKQSGEIVGSVSSQVTAGLVSITGAAGPLGPALGMVSNFATRGKLDLAAFIGTGAGVAAVGAAFGLLTAAMDANAAKSRLAKERTEDFTGALLAGKDALAVYFDTVRNEGKLEGFDPTAGLFGEIEDFLPKLRYLGVGINQFRELLALGEDGIKTWAIAAREGYIGTVRWFDGVTNVNAVEKLLLETTKNLGSAQTQAAYSLAFQTTATAQLATATDGAANYLANLRNGLEDFPTPAGTVSNITANIAANWNAAATAGNDFYAATERAKTALENFGSALRAQVDPQFRVIETQLRAKQALADYTAAAAAAERSNKPKDLDAAALAWVNYTRSLIDAGDAVAKLSGRTAGQQVILAGAGNVARINPSGAALLQNLADVAGSPTPGSSGFGMTQPNLPRYRTSSPGSVATAAANVTTTTNNQTNNVTYQITVNGAFDPAAVAAQIRRIINDDKARRNPLGISL